LKHIVFTLNPVAKAKPSPKPYLTRIPPEFDASPEGAITIEILRESWDWPRVKQLLDGVPSLSGESKTTDSNIDNLPLRIQVKTAVEDMARKICPLLPGGKGDLKEILASAKEWNLKAWRGGPEAKAVLKTDVLQFRALARAVRYRLAENFCRLNWRNWDKRAYRFYKDLQYNLGKFRRVHFLTLTFTGNPNYERVCKLLKNVTGNRLCRQGFESVSVVAFHPEEHQQGRIHVHMLCWSQQPRSLSEEKSAIEGILAAISQSRQGIGFTDYQMATGAAEILKVSAYLALNYSLTLRQPKGPDNPIPKGKHVSRPPQNAMPGVKWIRVGKISLVNRATKDWRRAVSRYAAATGRPLGGDLRWIWRERRRIRHYIEPLECWEVGVTGLDGYTYRVIPEESDHVGNEIYRLSSDERGDFFLTESAFEDLAAYQIEPGALPKNPRFDLTTGKAAHVYEVLGMTAFLRDRSRRSA